VLRWLPKFVLVSALSCSIGLHWAFFQALAWTNMVAAYSREATLAEALAKTFDGNHPCELCKRIAEGKRTEKKSEGQFEAKKLDLACLLPGFIFIAPGLPDAPSGNLLACQLMIYAPAVPPPRLLT